MTTEKKEHSCENCGRDHNQSPRPATSYSRRMDDAVISVVTSAVASWAPRVEDAAKVPDFGIDVRAIQVEPMRIFETMICTLMTVAHIARLSADDVKKIIADNVSMLDAPTSKLVTLWTIALQDAAAFLGDEYREQLKQKLTQTQPQKGPAQ